MNNIFVKPGSFIVCILRVLFTTSIVVHYRRKTSTLFYFRSTWLANDWITAFFYERSRRHWKSVSSTVEKGWMVAKKKILWSPWQRKFLPSSEVTRLSMNGVLLLPSSIYARCNFCMKIKIFFSLEKKTKLTWKQTRKKYWLWWGVLKPKIVLVNIWVYV